MVYHHVRKHVTRGNLLRFKLGLIGLLGLKMLVAKAVLFKFIFAKLLILEAALGGFLVATPALSMDRQTMADQQHIASPGTRQSRPSDPTHTSWQESWVGQPTSQHHTTWPSEHQSTSAPSSSTNNPVLNPAQQAKLLSTPQRAVDTTTLKGITDEEYYAKYPHRRPLLEQIEMSMELNQ